jgi:hypothetical protein
MKKMLFSVAAVAVLLTGCGGTTGAVSSETPQGTNAPAASSASTDTPAESPSPSSSELKLGQTYTYTDGLSVTVSKATIFKPSDTAFGLTKGQKAVYLTFTVVNKTGKAFDPALFYVTVQSGSTEAEPIYDSAKGINGTPNTKILNNRQATFKEAYSVTNPKDLVVEVNPGAFEYDAVIFTS